MKERTKSALILAPFLVIVFLGGYFLIAGVILLTIIALREFSVAFGEKRPAAWVFWTSLGVLYAGFMVLLIWHSSIEHIPATVWFIRLPFLHLIPGWVVLSVVLCLLSMFSMEKRDLIHGAASFIGIFYIIFFTFHLVLVDGYFSSPYDASVLNIPGFRSYVWILLLSAFGTDIFAYLIGKAIGKRKLCPSISPKKTIEGSIGGILGSVLLCGLFSVLFMRTEFWTCIVIGVAGGIFSQFGDLAASVMKRKMGLKDWGTLIPGHGGVLDRVDSVLFTAPLVYYILVIKEYMLMYGLI